MQKQFLIGLMAVSSLSWMSATSIGQDLPTAEKVLQTYVKKTGGMERYQAVKSMKTSGEMSVPAANLSGKLNIVFMAPDKFYFKADMGALGVQERGSNGKVVWENSTIQGARIIKGDEAEQILEEISMAAILAPKKFYKKMETVGKEKVKGEPCYVLELTRKNGNVDKDFYSIESGLKLKTVRTLESPLGKMEIESFESNYRKSNNGLLSSWTGEQKVGPNSIMVKMSSVEFNVDIDQSFELPAAVKELIDN